ncbi:MAG: outer membrane beta-barrel family protein [Flavobacterium sp.]|uniref:outer membrane beta-barrel family protein n=1 Tax=Flavobacterium sp. TaxID=239 RepID=UPI0032657F0A
MLIRKLKILFFIALFPMSVFSQFTITGTIENNSNKSLEIAEVVLFSIDGNNSKSELINSNGGFSLIIKRGNYNLQIKQLGNILYEKEIIVNKNIDLGVIKLDPIKKLNEIRVVGKKKLIERKVDRLIFNVDNSIVSQGMNGIDMLRSTPMLYVDERQGVSIIGKSGLSIMINNKIIHLTGIELTNYLQTIKSDNIAKIEVITTPPAKYDAQGNSGIVNIVLKKNTANGWNAKLGSTTKKNTLLSSQNDLTFNYQATKLNFTVNGYKYKNGFAPIGTRDLISSTGDNIHTTENRIDDTKADGFDFTSEYKINNKSDMSMMFESYKSSYNMDSDNTSVYDIMNSTSYQLSTNSQQRWKTPSLTLDLFYDLKLDTLGKKVSLSGNFSKSNADRNNSFLTVNSINPISNDILTTSNMKNQIYSGQIDFTLPYKWSMIETGGKFTLLDNLSSLNYKDKINDEYVKDLTKSNFFDYKEYNYAFYFSAEKEINEKWSTKLGLRYEWTNSKGFNINGDNFNKKYGYIFPTYYLSYNPNTNHNFSVNFSTRINRPSLFDMNPSRWYSNPYMYSEGNVNLKPSISYNSELSYTFKSKLTISLYNQYSVNDITSVAKLDGSIYNNTKRNAYKQNSSGLTIGYYNTFFSRWELSTNANIFYINAKPIISELIGMKQYSMTYNINNTININKTKTFSGSINFFHNLPNIYGTTYLKNIYGLSSGIRMFLLEKNLKINLSVSDILKTTKSDGYTKYDGYTEYLTQYNDYRKLSFGCSYNFGNKKVKKVSQNRDFEENNRKN